MKLEAFLIADAATDSQGKINVLGAFDTIYAKQIPVVHPALSIVIRLRLHPDEAGEHDLQISIKNNQNDDIVPPLIGKFGVNPDRKDKEVRANIILHMQTIEFREYGELWVHLTIDGDLFSTIPFYVEEPKTNEDRIVS